MRTMAEIVLTTLNARYAHCAFGLRYLMANLGELQTRARLLEFDISQRPLDVAEAILAHEPRIVGLGVYVWNAELSRQLVAILKRLRPGPVVVLGGPEVSHEADRQEICQLADHVIAGPGEVKFAALCRERLGLPPAPATALALPYDLYTDNDIAHRVIYVEASRGCPFECEFCLSSLDEKVEHLPLAEFLSAMERLLGRGCQQFKFVDRTFNLDVKTSGAILRFFRERYRSGMFLHFEMIPDRFPAALRELVESFPAGALQFEVGIQTFNPEVAARISRRQDNAAAEANLCWLRERTGVHIHSDLIVGLPGESVESFAAGFDRLVALRPHEIQVGILKRLRGAPIARHDDEWGMVYSPVAPYEILENKLIDFATMQRLRRFARYWDLVANSGRFGAVIPELWRDVSAFAGFLKFSDWLFAETRQTHGIALARLTELIGRYLGRAVVARTGAESRQDRHSAGNACR